MHQVKVESNFYFLFSKQSLVGLEMLTSDLKHWDCEEFRLFWFKRLLSPTDKQLFFVCFFTNTEECPLIFGAPESQSQ